MKQIPAALRITGGFLSKIGMKNESGSEKGGIEMKLRIGLILCLLLLAAGCSRNPQAQAEPPEQRKPAEETRQRQEPKQPEPEAPDSPKQLPAPPEQPAQPAEQEIASVSTPLLDKSPGRLKNIELAAGQINGAVIPPGASFSFNQAVGERTAEKGYQKAIVFRDKEQIQGLGGGICQLSSTLYLAAQQGGLEVTERHAHQLPVHYVDQDQDAAIEFGSLDLVFVNNTDRPLRVGAWLTQEAVITSLTALPQ